MTTPLRDRYGAWALVAGASEGLGEAYARGLAARGLDLVLVARRADELASVAASIRAELGVQVVTASIDLASPDAIDEVRAAIGTRELGLLVYNAAYAPVGPFLERTPAQLSSVVDVNVRAPLLLSRALAGPMLARRRGAIVLMSSVAGTVGTARIAAYSASKAFNTALAEALWHELRPHGIDVVACCAGAIRTPGYAATSRRDAPGTLDASTVADATLRALGRGPRVVPGWINKIAALVVGRWLPRRLSIAVMASSTRELS